MNSGKNDSRGLILAGGGTGGHIWAAVAVAEAWKIKSGSPILFVGAQGGLEERLVPQAGIPLKLLKLGSLNRVSWKTKFHTMLLLPKAFYLSAKILLEERPRAVLGVGGYASGPMLLMARIFQILGLLRAQVAILEQNAVPGFTNRVLAKFVTKVFMAFPNQEVSFQGKAYWTGNPTRANLKAAPYPELGNRLKIFVFGGSQGARSLNRLVLGLIPKLKSRFPNLHFDWIHQTGSQDYDMVSREHQALGTGARVEKFIDDMQSCYQSSHLVICRAGASTLSELAAVGRPSVLVPFPYASDQHQDHNAQIFAKNGGAMIYFERPSHEEDFQSLVVNLIAEPEKLVRMAEAARSFFKPRASEEIVERLFED